MYIKSPLNYTGGKYQLLDTLLNIFPKNIDTFVDLFAGGFNVGININSKKIVCNDQIKYLIDLYTHLRENSSQSILEKIKNRILEFNLSQENEEGYNTLRKIYNEKKDILDLFILTCFSFNHQIRFNNSQKFNTPFGKNRSSYNPNIERNLIMFCNALHQKNIEFIASDFTKIDLSNLGSNDFVYCDPPYLISTGSYNDGKRGFKDWTEKEESDLLTLLDNLDKKHIKFALSNVMYHKGLENELLINWSKKYNVIYLDKKYSNCSYQLKNKKAQTVEVLIVNFETKGLMICQQASLF